MNLRPYLHERCSQCWIKWKINFQTFPIFIFWVMVDIVLEIYQKLTNFEYKNDHISKTTNCKNWKIYSPFVSVHSTSFEIFCQKIFFIHLVKNGKKKLLSIWLKCSAPPGLRPWTPHVFGLRTLASQVLAQRHSRIACYSVFLLISHAP